MLLCTESAFTQNPLIDSLQHIIELQKRDTVELNALLILSFEFSRKDIDKAKSYAHRATALASKIGNDSKLSGAYQYLVGLHQSSGRMDSATFYLSALERLWESNPSNSKITSCYRQAAGLFYKNQGEYKKALPFMLTTLKSLPYENETRAGQMLNIGNVYYLLGDYKNSMNYHLQSLSLFEKLNSKRGQSFCLQSLGNDFFELNQFDLAKKYFERSLTIKTEQGDKRGSITAWTGLGDVSKELNQYATAKDYYLKALKASRELNLVSEEARCTHQLGLLYKRMGDVDSARENILKSQQLARQAGDSALMVKIKFEIIGLDLQEKKEKATESSLTSSLNTFINLGDRKNEALTYYRLSQHYGEAKQFEQAFYYHKKYLELKDSVEGSDVLLQLKRLEEQFQSEKNEKEIAILKKDQELQALALSRERSNVVLITIALLSVLVISVLLINRYRVMNRAKRMSEMETMRNTIARDLHDDIGSTLSSINIMSQIALQQNGNTGQQHLLKIANHSARMMENMSDIVWSINPKNDSLEQLVTKMKEFASEILEPKEIGYKFYIDSTLLNSKIDVEKRKNIFLIFKEAINNTAKYSEGNQATISLFEVKGNLHLTIGDNGKGFDSAVAKKGNGLRNMEDRAKTIQSELKRSSKPGEGTQIELEVPLT